MPNGHYQLGELLGRGGMGQVHVARHRSGRVVAVKRVRDTLMTDRLIVNRLSDEARLLCTVSHPNVVRALEHGTGSDGLPFLVMDRAHGTPLNQLLGRYGTLPPERIAAIASQLFAGLAAIHDAQIVHADLKSHNILVDEVNIVTIIDFGLARPVVPAPTSNGLIAGTPAYMAPEIIAGDPPGVPADIYAAATIIYEMLTGTTPFSGQISTILTRQLTEPVEPPSQRAPGRGISAAVDAVLVRALDTSPAARFPTVRAFAAAFADAFRDRLVPELMPSAELAEGSDCWRDEPTVRRPAAVTAPLPADLAADGTEAIISAVLTHAERLIASHCLAQAVKELEATMAHLMPSLNTDTPAGAAVWRIESVLAALYDSLGKQDHARRLALVAYRHALKTGCPRAEERASVLVDRLVARPRRLARGSVAGKR